MTQVLNTKGAARRLGCSPTWIHKLVAKGELRAYIYDETGELVERTKESRNQGQGLYFFAAGRGFVSASRTAASARQQK